jgi:hypothetical protein
VTKDLRNLASAEWKTANGPTLSKLNDLLGTMQWEQQREIAQYYKEELSLRESSRREQNMMRLTVIATVAGICALIVAVLPLFVAS